MPIMGQDCDVHRRGLVSQGLETSPVESSLHLEILLRIGTRRVLDGEVVTWKYSEGILGRQEDWADDISGM
jgi:hypothetical protein